MASTVLVVLLVAVGAGCTGSPPVAGGSVAQAQTRVLALVNETGSAIGPPASFTPVHSTNELPCVKKVLGFTVKHLAEHQVERPVIIKIAGKRSGASLLPRIAQYWKSRGFTIDRSGMSDHHFPKLRAHVGSDLIVATGYVGFPEINLYGVSACIKT